MPINPAFIAARALERRQRAITYLPHPPALKLPLRMRFHFWRSIIARNYLHGYVFGEQAITLCHYTERQRLELCFAENAFLTGREPLAGDVFQLLWRLHPDFIRPNSEMPNRRHPGHEPHYASDREEKKSLKARAALVRLLHRLDIPKTILILRQWLALSDQDAQSAATGEASPTKRRAVALPESCVWDDQCDYFGTKYGFSRDEVLDYPRAYLFQLYRNTLLAQPDSELEVFAPSDALLRPSSA